MKILWMILSCISVIYALDDSKELINKNTPYEATISVENNVTFLYFNHKKEKLSEPNEIVRAEYKSYKIDDFNFDGYDDIAILSGIGYGGVNMFYMIYITNDEKYEFQKDIILSNYELYLYIEKVVSEYKDGAMHFYEFYDVNGDRDSKYLHMYAKAAIYDFDIHDEVCKIIEYAYPQPKSFPKIVFCDELLNGSYPLLPLYAIVKSPKALLYNQPYLEWSKPKPNGMYLIKGDIVKLLNEEYLVEYDGKKTIKKYINPDDIEILQKHTYIHTHTVKIYNRPNWENATLTDTLTLQQIGKESYHYSIETFGTNADECFLEGEAIQKGDRLVAKGENNCTLILDVNGTFIKVSDKNLQCRELFCGHRGFFDATFKLFIDD